MLIVISIVLVVRTALSTELVGPLGLGLVGTLMMWLSLVAIAHHLRITLVVRAGILVAGIS